MATGQLTNLPPGYTLEAPQNAQPVPPVPPVPSRVTQPSTMKLPPGYTLETSAPSAPAATTSQPNPNTMGPRPKSPDIFDSMGIDPSDPSTLLSVPLAKVLIKVHEALKDAASMTQEGREQHPIQAKLGDMADSLEGFLFGGAQNKAHDVGSGKYGMLTNPVTSNLLPAGAGGKTVGSELVEGLPKFGEDLMNGARKLFKGDADNPGLVKKLVKGKSVEQSPAQTALRKAASDVGEATGTAPSTGGMRTLLSQNIEDLAKTERATYDALNKTAGTDLKNLYEYRSKLQDSLEDPAQIANEEKLQERLDTTNASIQKGEAQAIKNNVNPSTLKDATNMTKQRYALEDADKKLLGTHVEGNVANGAEESVPVDSTIKQLESMNRPGKYAPRGTPTRLQQAFPNGGAEKLIQQMYDAQRAGKSAVRLQMIGGALAVVGGAQISPKVRALEGGIL